MHPLLIEGLSDAVGFIGGALLGYWAGVLLGKRCVTQNGANDVVEVMRDAACHGAHSLHLVRFPQLRFQGVAVRLDLLAGAEIARKHSGGIAVWLALK